MAGRRWILACVVAVVAAWAAPARAEVSLAEVQAIAKEAYIYGCPLLDNYRVIYEHSVDMQSPEYEAPFNTLMNVPREFAPDDRAAEMSSADAPYAMLAVDLRAEPIVLTLPQVERGQNATVRLIDLFTFEFDSLGSHATGNGGGSLLIAGPNWNGPTPAGIKHVLRSETQLALAAYRTPPSHLADLENARPVQSGYQVEPLSAFLGVAPPPPAPAIEFLEPLSPAEERTNLEFFNELAFVLQFCPTYANDVGRRERFERLGIVPGRPFGTAFLTAGVKSALRAGMVDGQQAIDAELANPKSSADLIAIRDALMNDDSVEATSTRPGNEGDSKSDAFSIPFTFDAGGHPLDGSVGRYILTFAAGRLPPTKAYWSLTIYSLPDQRPVANPIDRYRIDSPMLPECKRDADGSLTIYIQPVAPGGERDANWLPAPDGPFLMILRLYRPEQSVLDNAWEAPAVERAPVGISGED